MEPRRGGSQTGGEGYFPRGESALRRVHGERIVGVLYGQRALLLQACHPLAFAGLNASSTGHDAPFKRLVSTAQTMEKVYFGTREEADRETARVRKMHARVRGALAEPAGPFPAGATYRADAPEFVLWILACLADSAQAVYERFVRRLADDEREDYWRDYVLLGELFGLPRSEAPGDYRAYRDYMRERLASDELHVVPEARRVGRLVAFDMPLPLSRRPGLEAINLAVIGLLPPRVRKLYGLRWTPAHAVALESMVRVGKVVRPFAPHAIRRGPSTADYEVVARAEARRGSSYPAVEAARAAASRARAGGAEVEGALEGR